MEEVVLGNEVFKLGLDVCQLVDGKLVLVERDLGGLQARRGGFVGQGEVAGRAGDYYTKCLSSAGSSTPGAVP